MRSLESMFAPLASHHDLSEDEAMELMRGLMGGMATEEEILNVLNLLCDKGVQRHELVSFAKVMQEKATMLVHPFRDLVDTCGTGGGRPTFNISTAAAFVAAGAGVKIAKHGNRSSTGLGSADILEYLGVGLGATPEVLIQQLECIGICFMFAPAHHPAMKHVAAARRALGRRSVFNLLGPLSNPAGANRQLIGVYDASLLQLMAEAVLDLGIERSVIVHSDDGLDEISPCTSTQGFLLWDGELKKVSLTPEDFGIPRLTIEQLSPGNGVAESAAFLEEAISNIDSAKALSVIPGAAMAIWLSGLEPDLASSSARARASIEGGYATKKLSELTNSGRPN